MSKNGTQEVPDFESLTPEEQSAIINGPAFNSHSQQVDQEQLDEDVDNVDEEDIATPEDPIQDDPAEDPADTPEPKKTGVQKLLEQRNDLRDQVTQYKQDLTAAQERIRELTNQEDRTQEEDLELVKLTTKETILDSDIQKAEKAEKDHFYKSNPKATEDKEAIEAVLQKFPSMSYTAAYRYLLATTPWREAELISNDKKANPSKFSVPGAWSASGSTQKEMTTAEYEAAAKKAHAAGKSTPFLG